MNQSMNQMAAERAVEIERLVAKVSEMAAASKSAVDNGSKSWGHVGDMARLIEGLKDLVGENG
jgi:hypothetical protein